MEEEQFICLLHVRRKSGLNLQAQNSVGEAQASPKKSSKLTKYFNSGCTEKQEEYSTYIIEPLLDFEDVDEALLFWKRNQKRFPVLCEMVRDYFAIQVSSAPVERVFSDSGSLYSKKRNRMNPNTLERHLLLYHWRRK